MVKHLLCEIQWTSSNLFIQEKWTLISRIVFDFNCVPINFENMYAQGRYDDRKLFLECGPMNLSPKAAKYIHDFIKSSLGSIVNAISKYPFVLRVLAGRCFVVWIYIFIRFLKKCSFCLKCNIR